MVKINNLEIENVKRVRAVKLQPSENGLTIIGGDNGQGKTSVLDAIAWALGGDKFKPSTPEREGSVVPPFLHVELSNGLVVERKGDKSSLKVIDKNGNKGGQQLLNEFVEALALNLPKFMQATARDKADTLLKIIGVGDQLYALEAEEQRLYNTRTGIGQIADQKAKYAKEMPIYTGIPKEPVSASELIRQQQDILARNGENQRKREQLERYGRELAEARTALAAAQERLSQAEANVEIAWKSAEDLHDESTAELEANIADIDQLNAKIRANLDRERAEIEADGYKKQYEDLTAQIEKIRQDKRDLLNGAELPLEGLSVERGELTYNGFKWDNMSGSEQLKVATAIVRKLNPECGFVLMDKLEQMDHNTLEEFGSWCEQENLQVIATRVSTGDECSIIITDGIGGIDDTDPAPASEVKPRKTWRKGEF